MTRLCEDCGMLYGYNHDCLEDHMRYSHRDLFESKLSRLPIINDAWCLNCGEPSLVLASNGHIVCAMECEWPEATHVALKEMNANKNPASKGGSDAK